MTSADLTVEYYVDSHGNDCYRICCPDGTCSIVSSAHLIEERNTYTGLYQERLAQLVERDVEELLGEAT
jgi:hypothetical protein